ncbi:predicted protein [Naegleria gruberi]|uniref:Predicted protein n=1 Tax=Naegleria gruberi TaxID=5762 RepID=D2V6A0_NAEGR|nr:uncharacterized protein NAEGRDRAFT_64360 [Naegleria gruberi]EFC47410.1 predicted protein [Naegleria gruberi]|eukprot:XP_002680154.1 predicted protein [Naegleria gruberi strain NEG-M]
MNFVIVILLCVFFVVPVNTQTLLYNITTVVGGGNVGDGLVATSAKLYYPSGIAISSSDETYIADTNNHRIRKITTSGIISTIAGNGTAGYSGDGSSAKSAQLYYPSGVAISSSDEIYIVDRSNNRIRKITTSGIISTIAGNGTAGYSGDVATSAKLYYPSGIAISSSDETYIADTNNHRIRKITTSGIISTIAGNGTAGYSGDGSSAKSAQLYYPSGVAISSSDEIYIVDRSNNRIRKITTSGIISTIAGNGTAGYSGDGSSATSAQLNSPSGIAISSSDEIYIADMFNNRIRKITTSGIISTIAGTGTSGYSGDGSSATSIQLYFPYGVAVSLSDEIYIADMFNNRIRKITTSGIISTIAGGIGDGLSATTAYINAITFEFSSSGEIYIADTNNHRIRKITTSGIISTIAGTGTSGYSGDGSSATSAQLNSPYGIAISSSGEIYIADTNNNRIRKITTSGIISTIAGTGTQGYSGDGSSATSAQLYNPYGVAISSRGEIYVADYNNNRIRKITTSGIISTIAGTGTSGYSGDGSSAISAQLYNPYGVAISSSDEIYITDTNNNRIRKLSPWCTGNAILLDGSCEYPCFGTTNKIPAVVCSGKGSCIGYNQCNCTADYFGYKWYLKVNFEKLRVAI